MAASQQSNEDMAELARRERRGRVRVRDAIWLQVRKLDEVAESIGSVSSVAKYGQFAASTPVKLNKYELAGYAEVKAKYPEVSEYIAALEEEIRAVTVQSGRPVEEPSHKVSLSASGLAFADSLVMKPEDTVLVDMVLFPQTDRISCEGRIVTVGDAPEVASGDKHTYRLRFTNISDADVELIEKHVTRMDVNMSMYTQSRMVS